MSALTEMTEELLVRTAIFLARDEGSAGFLDRCCEAVHGDARLVSQALDQAMTAQALAGYASIQIEPGDLLVQTTSSGASLTACAVPGPEGCVSATVRLVDASRRPVEGAALQVRSQGQDQLVVTNTAGWVHIGGAGPSISISVGRTGAAGHAESPDAPTGMISLPRPARNGYTLAALTATHTSEADQADRWRVVVRGVEFMCQERKGGYDLTVLVTGVGGEFAESALGTHSVSFRTQDQARQSRDWIVPLAPSPLGLAGSLYGTCEDYLDADSVTVSDTEQLIMIFGDRLEEAVSRSVRHSDTVSAWTAVHERLAPGRPRKLLKVALVKREKAL